MEYLATGAVLSDCGKYRYLLRREWRRSRPRATFIMLNPSTADAHKDDATIRSCVRLVDHLGYGSLDVVNLMAYRATKPENLPTKPSLALGAGNAHHIENSVRHSDIVVCAWGAHPYARQFAGGALDIVSLYYKKCYCFGKTAAGAPKHPLYIKTGTSLQVYAKRNDNANMRRMPVQQTHPQ